MSGRARWIASLTARASAFTSWSRNEKNISYCPPASGRALVPACGPDTFRLPVPPAPQLRACVCYPGRRDVARGRGT
eukprot:899118-Prymnesium_polylepis.1